jgi:probable F420-dependent oxidoreductase
MDLGRIGIWSGPLRRGDRTQAMAAAAEIEALGFETAWMPGGEEGMGDHVDALLGATSSLVIATGIVNIWFHPASEAAAMHRAARREHGGRLLLGIGVGHAPLVDAGSPGRYREPLRSTGRYLDDLDAGPDAVPAGERVLAAFGPRMMELARDRTRGAHPYLVTPEHTRWARAILGPGALLAVEQHVVLDAGADRARALAREYLATYWTLPNYLANFRRMGFTEADFRDGGSDRMVDALVAWGDVDRALARVREHFDAGADHVCVQVLVPGKQGFPVAGWRALAAAIGGRA